MEPNSKLCLYYIDTFLLILEETTAKPAKQVKSYCYLKNVYKQNGMIRCSHTWGINDLLYFSLYN